MRSLVVALAAITIMSGIAHSEDQSMQALEPGNWITIYMNDFKDINFNGVSKNEVCVSGALEKAEEFRGKGLAVSHRLLMAEMVVLQAKGNEGEFLIYCNQNGALLVNMLIAGPESQAMAKGEAVGTETRRGPALQGTTRTETEKDTGKTTTTTETPTN